MYAAALDPVEMKSVAAKSSGRKSVITSFIANRFNNYSEAAAALHYHREDMKNCLQSLPRVNKKLESIQEDNKCDEIDCQLVALGLLFYR